MFPHHVEGANPEYARHTKELAEEFSKRGINLVYGGGTIGLMGILAKGVHAGTTKVQMSD